jgi:hypothetical protein
MEYVADGRFVKTGALAIDCKNLISSSVHDKTVRLPKAIFARMTAVSR